MSIYLKISRVGRDENLFIFFKYGNKNRRVGTKNQGRSGYWTQLFFFFGGGGGGEGAGGGAGGLIKLRIDILSQTIQ